MKVWGAQSQRFDGVVQAVRASQAAVWKVIDPDSQILADIKAASPNTTTIVRIYTGAPTVDDVGQHRDPEAYGREYATRVYAAVQDPAHMDLLESENEPNDHYGNLTEFIKRQSAFLVGFSGRAKQLGFRPLGPNFSTGYPECFIKATDYQLWPNAWQGLADGLRALRDAGGALGLHEYDSPNLFRLWSDAKQRGYLVGRHKAIYECLPADLQALPLYITEFGIDWLTQGTNGGFWLNRDDQAYRFMIDQARESWRRVYATTKQLKGICFFLWGATDPRFAEYDIRRTDESITGFTQLFREQLAGGVVVAPPAFAFICMPLAPLARTFPISQGFGQNPAYYAQFGLPGHEGIDYACPTGTIVLAVADGMVVESSSFGSYGLHVRIKHKDDWETVYAHLSNIIVENGAYVHAGDRLGWSGATGNVTGPHLHFSLRRPGFDYTDRADVRWPQNYFDPTPYLTAVTPGAPPPTKEPAMRTPLQIMNSAWQSMGIVHKADEPSAFEKKAIALGLGYPLGGEYRETGADGVITAGQCFGPEGVALECKEGDWGNISAFSVMTGLPWVRGTPVPAPSPSPTPTPPPAPAKNPARLTTVPPLKMPDGSMIDLGMKIIPYQPKPGEEFWGLVAVGAFKIGVGTQIILTARDAQGAVFDVPITHAWDEARQKSETVLTDGDGKRTIILGHGSDYTPPTPPPDRIYVSLGDGADGAQWPTPKGDIWVTGEPGGHFEGAATFQKMTG